MSFLFRSVAVARSAAASAVRPATVPLRFAPIAPMSLSSLRFSSTLPSSSTSTSTPTPGAPGPAAASARRPAFDMSGISHLLPSKVAEEDPDAWWRKSDVSLDRNFGKPGNQYTGRSRPVKGNYGSTYNRIGSMLVRTGTKQEYKRAQFHERPSERKRRLRSERWRRRFQEEVRQRVQIVQMLRSRK